MGFDKQPISPGGGGASGGGRHLHPTWRHHFWGFCDKPTLCCTSFITPCMVTGEVAREVGKPCYLGWCVGSVLPGINLVNLAHLRSELREQRGIPGDHLDDMCAACCCPFCTMMQMHNEIDDIRYHRHHGHFPPYGDMRDNQYHGSSRSSGALNGVIVGQPIGSSTTDVITKQAGSKIFIRF